MTFWFRHHHDHHVHNDPQLEVRLKAIEQKLDLINERFDTMARTLDDLLAQGNKVLDGVTKNTDLDNSIITVLNTDTQLLRDLRKQLAEAGQDPAKLEALGTLMDQVAASQDAAAQKKADAITANTDAG